MNKQNHQIRSNLK